jgi:adenylate cyclase
MRGPTTPEVEETYKRALELSEQAGDVPELLPVLLGLGWFYLTRGSLRAAREVGNRLLAMAETTRDPAVVLAAHHRLGLVSFYAGEFEAARAHLEQGMTLYSPARSPSFALIVDSGASSTFHAAWTLWVLGYPAQASARMHESLALARSIAQPFTLAHIQRFAAGFYLCLRERDAAREQAEACIAMSTEHGFDALLRAARFHRGWWLTEHARDEQGLALMRAWVAACRDLRALAVLPAYLAWLAEVHGRFGQPAEGLALVREALALGIESGNHYWTAELHRVMGILALQAGPGEEARRTGRQSAGADGQSAPPPTAAGETAEAAFREALEIARRQRAKSFELRAATSLSRLWAGQGREKDARALLSDVYGWFTEGLDTADLREAKALLAGLERTAAVRSRSR